VDLIEDHHRENPVHPVDRLEDPQRLGIVDFRGGQQMAIEVGDLSGEVADQLEIDLDASANLGIGELGGNPLAMALVMWASAELRQVTLAVGVLDVTEEIGPLADQVAPATQEIPGRAHLGGIDVGLGNHAATKESGNLAGVDPVVLSLPAMDGLHVEGMTENEGDLLLGAEISEPIPGEHALYGHYEILTEGSDGFEKGLGSGGEVLV
jgi:hypothetical protein